MKRFHCLTREEGKMGNCQARPVRPVRRTGQTGRTKSARKIPSRLSGEFPEYPGL